jgi:hypothetical protein
MKRKIKLVSLSKEEMKICKGSEISCTCNWTCIYNCVSTNQDLATEAGKEYYKKLRLSMSSNHTHGTTWTSEVAPKNLPGYSN